MKLEIQYIPATCFFHNLRSELSKCDWDILSKKVRELKGNKCQYCGAEAVPSKKKYLACHEVWEFDDVAGTQKLAALECVCKDCHMVHHWGLAEIMAKDGILNLEKLLAHACKVNECDEIDFWRHKMKQAKIWLERSGRKWSLIFNPDINSILREVKI